MYIDFWWLFTRNASILNYRYGGGWQEQWMGWVVFTYIQAHISTYVHTYTYTVCTYIHTYIRTDIHMYMHTSVHMYTICKKLHKVHN